MRHLILHNWLAKILALLLAITLWFLIKKMIVAPTTSRFNSAQFSADSTRKGFPVDAEPTPAPDSGVKHKENNLKSKSRSSPTPSKTREK